MGRQPRRASGVKALQAIKETSQTNRTKATAKKYQSISENASSQPAGVKRSSSPGSIMLPSAKRNALGDVTNNAVMRAVLPVGKQAGVRKLKSERQTQQPVALKKTSTVVVAQSRKSTSAPTKAKSKEVALKQAKQQQQPINTTTARPPQKTDLNESVGPSQSSIDCEPTPVTAVQNFLQATTLNDVSFHSEESLTSEESLASGSSSTLSSTSSQETSSQNESSVQLWRDIDKAEAKDPLFSSEYAPDIYTYMNRREELMAIPDYMSKQTDINSSMRTILIDWLVEVQENFELFHETLYIAVRLVDTYLSRKEVKREYLQLVGATCMLIAAKFEELCPPLVDDFLYLCDDAYTRDDLLRMERDILKVLNYDVNMPIAYRFLRRLARACEATMETHTLARYFSEHSLQEYDFVMEKPSYVAAASMYLALRMKKLGGWTPTLQHYSGYTVEEMLPMVKRLNTLIQKPLGQTCTVRSKYSHEVFFKVALTPPLVDVVEDAEEALLQSQTCTSTTNTQ